MSPLRYPGGKASLAGYLGQIIKLNKLIGCRYFEPYAGGAGAALTLLIENSVSELCLNDADPRIYAFWYAALYDTERFIDKVLQANVSIDEWKYQSEICKNPKSHSRFDVGFSAFFMNRCNRSGILTGSGPIGGHSQLGEWKIDARYNKEVLAARIARIGELREHIFISNLDALEFLVQKLPRGNSRKKVFAYLDPPYFNKGKRLYLNHYLLSDHARLSMYIQRQKTLNWVMSYDATDEIMHLYRESTLSKIPIRYSLQSHREKTELLITPAHVTLPATSMQTKTSPSKKVIKKV
ncbi:MAG: DNA adenine methylase [Kiritimatiellales bacterium]|nr:DNA adenine methylase [Kiritimatiellales bacterium]MCF7863285.1 DNA adenine methylase [Kiritimatiellales bacterium]